MTTLLIDLGNTALKWTPIEEPDNPHTIIHKGSTHFKEELYDLWLNMRPKRIIGCTVAAPVVAFSLTKFFNDHGIRWNWVRTQPSFHGRMTLNNCYENPGQLGADRWYAAVRKGARFLSCTQARPRPSIPSFTARAASTTSWAGASRSVPR